jgi:hypothetical protein
MKTLFGGILLAIGILIAGASGLCSLAVLFSSGGELGSGLGLWPLVLVIGGIPFAVGAGMGCGGWALIRQARRERQAAGGDVSEIFE